MDDILDEKTYETRNVEYVPFSVRTAAFLMDLFIFAVFTFGLNYMFEIAPGYLLFMKAYWWKTGIVLAAYFVFFDGGESNATLGKQIMNIRLLNEEKRDIDYSDSVKHFFLSVLLFFGYPVLLSNEKRQTLADKICKVIVVKVR